MEVIGITGGVGAGKTSILTFLKDNYKCEIIVADELAKNLCLRGGICYDPLVKLLSTSVLNEDLEIDKAKMASMIFGDRNLLMGVNGIIHPGVKNYIKERIVTLEESKEVDFLFIEAALLIEDGYKAIVDELWYIYTDENIRRERLKASRGYSDEKIDSILKSQLSDKEFRDNADFVIDNSHTSEESFTAIRKRMEEQC